MEVILEKWWYTLKWECIKYWEERKTWIFKLILDRRSTTKSKLVINIYFEFKIKEKKKKRTNSKVEYMLLWNLDHITHSKYTQLHSITPMLSNVSHQEGVWGSQRYVILPLLVITKRLFPNEPYQQLDMNKWSILI